MPLGGTLKSKLSCMIWDWPSTFASRLALASSLLECFQKPLKSFVEWWVAKISVLTWFSWYCHHFSLDLKCLLVSRILLYTSPAIGLPCNVVYSKMFIPAYYFLCFPLRFFKSWLISAAPHNNVLIQFTCNH